MLSRLLILSFGLTAAAFAAPAQLEVNCAKPLGQIRPLHGGNCGPIHFGNLIDLSDYFREIGFPLIRLHDCHWPNVNVVDIHTIFRNLSADPENAESYDFRRTDDYLQSIVATGCGIVYRLGESIEHTKRQILRPSAGRL